ncbi:MAG: hypothetical protein PHX54_09340 [Lentimicrobiaceae bacterium]|nr:hypothetical protein [Lentimicrobiaceae bacterium]
MKNITIKLTLVSVIFVGLILSGFAQKSPVTALSKEAQGLRSPRNGAAIYDQLFPPGAFTINSQAYTDPRVPPILMLLPTIL